MGLIEQDTEGRLYLTAPALEHLVPGTAFDVSSYVRLAADNPSVQGMISALRSKRPVGADDEEKGAAFIFRDGVESAMDWKSNLR
jgi:hypothetical protein